MTLLQKSCMYHRLAEPKTRLLKSYTPLHLLASNDRLSSVPSASEPRRSTGRYSRLSCRFMHRNIDLWVICNPHRGFLGPMLFGCRFSHVSTTYTSDTTAFCSPIHTLVTLRTARSPYSQCFKFKIRGIISASLSHGMFLRLALTDCRRSEPPTTLYGS